ncbi:MAG: hypothetical protein FJ125_08700 [Deltaproteobacteria bacterium]|nr:hypothetical protein [Deltaproteobacteria bacterium]
MVQWPYKLEHAISQHYFRLYDLENDPLESKDLLAVMPDLAARLITTMRTWESEVLAEIPSGQRGGTAEPGRPEQTEGSDLVADRK